MDYLTAVSVKTKKAAESALGELIQQAQLDNPELTNTEAHALQVANIGYFLGYLSDSDRIRAMELYPEAVHPIFGRQFDLPPTVCMQAGMALAKAIEAGVADPAAAARRVIETYNQQDDHDRLQGG